MRVKIENTWYEAENTAICLELTEEDKNNIIGMSPEATKYACFPHSDPRDTQSRMDWMKT